MAQVNFAKGEVQCKVVFYGPAQSGKTANLRTIHERSPEHVRGKLTSIATDGERTLFFDYLPLNLGKVAGIRTKINIYAVPYLAGHNALRMLVLEGVDGIVFVADSSRARVDENREAFENLRTNLAAIGRDLTDVPLVFQWNKSDVEDAMSAAEMVQALDTSRWDSNAAAAETGAGVLATLKSVTRQVLQHVSGMMAMRGATPDAQAEPEPEPQPEPQPISQPEPTPEPTPEPEPITPQIVVNVPEDDEDEGDAPVFRPAWHRQAPEDSTNTNPGMEMPDPPSVPLEPAGPGHRPLRSIQHGNKLPQESKREPEEPEKPALPPMELDTPALQTPEDEPLEMPRESEPSPDLLKIQAREAERAPVWEDVPGSESFIDEPPQQSFPAFGGGMAPADELEKVSRLVTVGGGAQHGNVRTVRHDYESWDPENSPQPLRSVGQPALERRRRPRTQWRAYPPPLAHVAAGA
ncbi:MAG: ADP-ribosylation factor-like protein, partial [Planctomycetota bacterium]